MVSYDAMKNCVLIALIFFQSERQYDFENISGDMEEEIGK